MEGKVLPLKPRALKARTDKMSSTSTNLISQQSTWHKSLGNTLPVQELYPLHKLAMQAKRFPGQEVLLALHRIITHVLYQSSNNFIIIIINVTEIWKDRMDKISVTCMLEKNKFDHYIQCPVSLLLSLLLLFCMLLTVIPR